MMGQIERRDDAQTVRSQSLRPFQKAIELSKASCVQWMSEGSGIDVELRPVKPRSWLSSGRSIRR